MSTTAVPGEADRSTATKLGLHSGDLVLEIGYDDDCDEDLRAAIEAVTGSALLEDDTEEVVDAVLLWWRDDDGDLIDGLVDALTFLADGGTIWLLTPKAGREGHVEPSDIGEAAPTAGLQATSSVAAAADWSGTRLVSPKSSRR